MGSKPLSFLRDLHPRQRVPRDRHDWPTAPLVSWLCLETMSSSCLLPCGSRLETFLASSLRRLVLADILQRIVQATLQILTASVRNF